MIKVFVLPKFHIALKNIKPFFIKVLFFISFLFSNHTLLANSIDNPEIYFKNKVAFINQSLKDNQAQFEASTPDLAKFVDQQLIPLWQSTKTMQGLLGKSNWLSMKEEQHLALTQTFNNTLQRYVQEGFGLYDGQKLEYVAIKLNKAKNRGILTLKIIPNIIPSFEVNFKIIKNDHWQLYDVLIQGVSYVKLKRDGIRKKFSESGVKGVLKQFNQKNIGYIESNIRYSMKNDFNEQPSQTLNSKSEK